MNSIPRNVLDLVKQNDVRFIDFRFTDMHSRWHHIAHHISQLSPAMFSEGVGFDGSSLDGWCDIEQSDMSLLPDSKTAFIDPFTEHATLALVCDVIDPFTRKPYSKCPRGIAKRAEEFIKKSGVADGALFGPELEFFVFDTVHYQTDGHHMMHRIESRNGVWASADAAATGHVLPVKGGYFKMPPFDPHGDLRAEIIETLHRMGIVGTLHHGEVANGGQCEVGMEATPLTQKGDQVMMLKHAVRMVADMYGKTATFMPKPMAGDNGSGMHVHQSLSKNGKNIFAGDVYAGLSQTALHYIGGIIKHARAINAFTNPLTNSYKRLVPGFEAPVMLAYANRNRSASIRIPAAHGDKARRIEVRFPDPGCNPYLGMAAMLLAGLDGVKNKINPGAAMEENLYELPKAKQAKVPQVCGSLRDALNALDKGRTVFTANGVFSDEMITSYIEQKMHDVHRLEQTPHPVEFSMYYGV